MFGQAIESEIDAQEAVFGDRTIYLIPEQNMPKFEKEIGKLSRRSERLIGQKITPVVFAYEWVLDEEQKPLYRNIQVYLTAETPKIDGWTFVARIDHTNETGNVIRQVPNLGVEIPETYRTCQPNCDHCRVRRMRRDTFLIQEETTGNFQQVGTNCLTDFFGHNPYKIAKLAEMLGYADEIGRASTTVGEAKLVDRRWFEVEDFLVATAVAIRNHGWVSGSTAYQSRRDYEDGITSRSPLTATRAHAFGYYHDHDLEKLATDDDRALAASALEWARSFAEKVDLSDYEHNCSVVANATYIEGRSLGIAASIVGVYERNRRRERAASMPSKVQIGDMAGVIDLMKRPGSAIKYPKIKFAMENGARVELSIAGPGSKNPGAVNITDGGPYGNNTWYGRISPTGEWVPSRSVDQATMSSLTALLTALSADPAATASAYGKRTGHCCFCNKSLNDERSLLVGYGGTCAKNYGLPWGARH